MLASLGADLDTRTPVHRLGVAQQQMVEIAKALSQKARILVMDEPTAALSDPEIARLFAIIRTLQRDGVAVLYISHRLQEIFAIGDRITVLRDGRKVAELASSATDRGRPGAVDGRTRGEHDLPAPLLRPARRAGSGGGSAAAPRTASGGRVWSCRAGEIVGLAGLVGAGRTELARAIFGADRLVSGEVRVRGKVVHGGPARLVAAGAGPGAGGSEAAGPGARAIGAGQPAGGRLAPAVSERLVSAGGGGPRRGRSDRAAARAHAVAAAAGQVSQRRQPAEGRDRQVDRGRIAPVHLRRADARHRRRRQGGNLPPDGAAGRGRARRC